MSEDGDEQQAGALDVFRALRPKLFGIAYRMLGSATDAEDLLQDAWLRWHRVELKTDTQLTREIHVLTTELHRRVIDGA